MENLDGPPFNYDITFAQAFFSSILNTKGRHYVDIMQLKMITQTRLLNNLRYYSRLKVHPLPHKQKVDLAYDVHHPEISLLGKLPYHSKEPIIFCHGLMGSKKNYESACKKIANALQTPVYCVDLRNHGDSEHAAPFDYSTLVNDLMHFIERHDTGKVNLIGYSLGAKIALLATLQHPEKFGSACIIENYPEFQPHVSQIVQSFMEPCAKLAEEGFVRRDDKSWRHKSSEFLKPYVRNPRARDYLLNNVVINPKRLKYKSPLIDYDDGFIKFKNPISQLTKISSEMAGDWPESELHGKQFLGATNFIRGTRSNFYGEATKANIEKYFPYYNISEINASHFILNERPREYVAATIEFFTTTRFNLEKKKQAAQQDTGDNVVNMGINLKKMPIKQSESQVID